MPSPDDEIAEVSRSFNRMAAALEDTEATRRQLLSNVAHELRTPLATLEGYVEGLEDGIVKPEGTTWRTLRDALARLDRLVDDIGAVSRAQEHPDLNLTTTTPAELALAAAAAGQPAAQSRGVRLEADADGGACTVRVDVERIGEALHNLVDNAIRHSSPGDEVHVEVHPRDPWVELTVADNGEGIVAADLPHVFERVYRADPSRRGHRGSGIGLTIVEAIARAHGDDVRADSRGPGTGARFTIRLPRTAATSGLELTGS